MKLAWKNRQLSGQSAFARQSTGALSDSLAIVQCCRASPRSASEFLRTSLLFAPLREPFFSQPLPQPHLILYLLPHSALRIRLPSRLLPLLRYLRFLPFKSGFALDITKPSQNPPDPSGAPRTSSQFAAATQAGVFFQSFKLSKSERPNEQLTTDH
jgi:hypothetical protein